jgi:gliding motility-associated-like protein
MDGNAHITANKPSLAQQLWVNKNTLLVFLFVLISSNILLSSPVPGCNMSSPKLNCLSVMPNGDVALTWSTPAPIDPAFDSYHIYRSSSLGGPYTVVDSIPSSAITSYTHNGGNVGITPPVFYYIEARCTGNIYTPAVDTLSNIDPPFVVFDTLSVDDSNRTVLSWYKSPSVNTNGYVIYRFDGAWIIIDTVLGINNTSYLDDSISIASPRSVQYRIAILNHCGAILAQNLPYASIHLTASPDICQQSARLKWTTNTASPNTFSSIAGLDKYQIYQSTVGTAGPYSLVGTVPAGTLSYTVAGLAPQTTYYFKITAVDTSGTKTTSSNRITFYSATPKSPQFLYLRSASVISTNQIDITCHVDVTASISYYKVFRAIHNDTTAPVYTEIGRIQPSKSSPVTFSDVQVNTNKYSYYYKVMIVDSCGFDGMETNVGHTILLSVSGKSIVQQNYLQWNSYGDWLNGVSSYNIYRGIDGVMSSAPIANIPVNSSGIYNYTDDVSSFLNGIGVFNYYIEAIAVTDTVFGFTDKSTSNVADAYQDPIIYVPNAFFPAGTNNKVFKPVITYIDNMEYEFTVFDRWGGLVFSTNDMNEAWDGTFNGKNLELGVFVYLIKIKTARGDYQTLKGTVTLLD